MQRFSNDYPWSPQVYNHTTHFKPPASRIDFVLKLQWAPAPFQSPGIGFGSNVTMIPKSSATRCSRNLAIHRWSPMVIPSQGPTWNSPCGKTNTLHISKVMHGRKRVFVAILDVITYGYRHAIVSYGDTY